MPELRPALTSALILTRATPLPLDVEARGGWAKPRPLSAEDLALTSLEQGYAQRVRRKRQEEIRFAEERLRGPTRGRPCLRRAHPATSGGIWRHQETTPNPQRQAQRGT